MRRETMEHYGIVREFSNAGFHETEQHRLLLRDITAAIRHGKFVALSGVIGCGKTTMLNHLQTQLAETGDILVAKSHSVDKERVTLSTLMLALFYDLSTERDFVIPTKAEKRERALRDLIRKRKKPVVLFIDEAHDLPRKTLVDLKRLMEMVRDGDGILSIVLAGHPRLKNDLRRPTMEEIGNRATVFSMDKVHGENRDYIYWLFGQCTKSETAAHTLCDDEAVDLLADRLKTPLQIDEHLTRALEEAFQVGGRPVGRDVVEAVLAKDINDLEPTLVRHGYGTKALAEMLDISTKEVRRFVRGQLPPGRTSELQSQLLKAGVPL
jgi:type II secretory pathway predicted ATPase ExeA